MSEKFYDKMKFTPRILKDNVNISHTSPLRELFVLLSGILGVLLVIYIVLGLALDILVEKMPADLEHRLGRLFVNTYSLKISPLPAEAKVQTLLDDLVSLLPEEKMRFSVHIAESQHANAMALPGGHILVFSKLLEEIKSENELAMILAHELGHFIHRDHLRGLGRGLVLSFISGALFGIDSAISNFSQRMLLTADLKFSRKQELAADKFALTLLNTRYGHVGGGCDFFERLKGREKMPRFAKFLSTHPDPVDRIRILQEEIKQNGYSTKEVIPLDLNYKDEPK